MVDFNNPGRWELYNLQEDPGEMKGLKEPLSLVSSKARNGLYVKILAKMTELNDPLLARVKAWETASGFPGPAQ